ncbi:MAG TPA: DegQ family serine endoprotease [Bryobacteraceae bacterium]|nr:DegQ family serine endoprotease [Bryobacteraceae bacterium]
MSNNLFKSRRWLATAAVTTALAVTGFLGVRAATLPHPDNPPANVKTAPRSEAASRRGYSAVVKKVVPAVVNISSSRVVKNEMSGMRGQPQGEMPQGLDPFFRQFFGQEFGRNLVPKERREKALGSGVIISPEGYILTNNHVVDHATEVTVTLSDKREMKARVVGTDPRTDIAVLKIEGSNFPSLVLGDSSKVEVGDIVLAIGDPFGVGQTVTSGIVSATGRGGLGIEEVEDFIQTDAPINPGNSGGALVDDEGHLIGINTAILSGNSGGNQGIGFAVPINMARHDMDQILAHGKVERGYLGILPQNITPAMAKALNISETNGALVGDVTANSPASKAGLKTGDIILSVNGEAVSDANQLRLKIGNLDPSSKINLKVMRDGRSMEIPVQLGEFPNQERASVNKDEKDGAVLGVSVENLTPETAQQLKLAPQTKGVVVNEVSPSSRAAEAGLQPGDVIQQVNRKPVTNINDFKQMINSAKTDSPVLLLVYREGTTLFLAV